MSKHTVTNLSEQELVRQVLAGDHQAFATIIKNTERLVKQIVFKMITSPADRKDIAQDVYLKVFHQLQNFRFQSKLSTWIGQIAYTTCLKYIEKKKPALFMDVAEHHEAIPDIGAHDPEQVLLQTETVALLTAEISLLPPVYQTLITLFHQEELSYAEIAQITSLPEGTVKSYLFRARKILKEKLLKKYKGAEL